MKHKKFVDVGYCAIYVTSNKVADVGRGTSIAIAQCHYLVRLRDNLTLMLSV